jgi:hypothetical protein
VTTITDLTNQIERELLVHYARPQFDVPASNYTNVATSVTLANLTTVQPGAILDAAFEMMLVTAFNSATKVATVVRGFLGTTAVAGTTSTLVRVNPPIPTAAIYDAVLDDLRSWDERLYKIELATVTFGASDTSIVVTPTANPFRILYARPRPRTALERRRFLNMRLRENENTTQFASGISLHIDDAFGYSATVDVAFAMPFSLTGLTTTTNLVSTTGLSEGMLEILKWGALYRIVAGKETRRLDPNTFLVQSQQNAFPATANVQTAAEYRKMRDMAYDREVRKLLTNYTPRFT